MNASERSQARARWVKAEFKWQDDADSGYYWPAEAEALLDDLAAALDTLASQDAELAGLRAEVERLRNAAWEAAEVLAPESRYSPAQDAIAILYAAVVEEPKP